MRPLPTAGVIEPGTIVRIEPYGAFCALDNYSSNNRHLQGLIHISQLAPQKTDKVEDVVSVDDRVWVKILEVEEGERLRIKLSLKDAAQDGSRVDLGKQLEEESHARTQLETNLNSMIGMGVAMDPMADRLKMKHQDKSSTFRGGYSLVGDDEGEPEVRVVVPEQLPKLPPIGRGRGATLPAWMTSKEAGPTGAKSDSDDNSDRKKKHKRHHSKKSSRKKHHKRSKEEKSRKRHRPDHSYDSADDSTRNSAPGEDDRKRSRRDRKHHTSERKERKRERKSDRHMSDSDSDKRERRSIGSKKSDNGKDGSDQEVRRRNRSRSRSEASDEKDTRRERQDDRNRRSEERRHGHKQSEQGDDRTHKERKRRRRSEIPGSSEHKHSRSRHRRSYRSQSRERSTR